MSRSESTRETTPNLGDWRRGDCSEPEPSEMRSFEARESCCDYQIGDRRASHDPKCGLATSWEADTEKRADSGELPGFIEG